MHRKVIFHVISNTYSALLLEMRIPSSSTKSALDSRDIDTIVSFQTELADSKSGKNPQEYHHRQDHHSPELDTQCVLIKVRLSCEGDGRKHQHKDHVATDPVILVERLGSANGAI